MNIIKCHMMSSFQAIFLCADTVQAQWLYLNMTMWKFASHDIQQIWSLYRRSWTKHVLMRIRYILYTCQANTVRLKPGWDSRGWRRQQGLNRVHQIIPYSVRSIFLLRPLNHSIMSTKKRAWVKRLRLAIQSLILHPGSPCWWHPSQWQRHRCRHGRHAHGFFQPPEEVPHPNS